MMGRRRAKLRRSPLTEYWRAGKVTLRPTPLRRSQIAKPISFSPSSSPSVKCSSASANLPGGVPLSLGVILTCMLFLLACLQRTDDDGFDIRHRFEIRHDLR